MISKPQIKGDSMFWSILPGVLSILILTSASNIKIGNFRTDNSYNLLIPESVWGNFKIFLVTLLSIALPVMLVSTLAKARNKKNLLKYPNSRITGWSSSLDQNAWSILQIFAALILAILVIIYLIFN